MAITYIDIEERKNARIWIFYCIVILFYFIVAIILGMLVKAFYAARISFLTINELCYVLLAAVAAALIHVIYSISNARNFVGQNLGVQELDQTDAYHNRFMSIVEELGVATGNKYTITPVVIPTVAMNAFAICDRNKTAMLGVTEGLLSKLTRQQLETVVAHEVGHIVSGDSLQTTIACSLFGVYAAMLSGAKKMFGKETPARGSGVAALFVVIITLNIAQFFYNIIRLFISREREFRADAIAVQLSRDPVSLAEALYTISSGWRGLGYIEPALESLFIMNPVREGIDEEDGFLADLFSTHPPVDKRISILTDMAHTSMENIQADVLAQNELRESSREMPKAAAPSGPVKIGIAGMTGEDRSVFRCPKCGRFLSIEDYEGLRVYHCRSCDGYLIDENKLPRIIIRKEKGFDSRIKRLAELTQKDGLAKIQLHWRQRAMPMFKCPKCGGPLLSRFYTLSYLVEVDRCLLCNLVWLDKDDLEITQYLIENEKGV